MLAAACSKYKYETVAGDPLNTRIYTLDNGLKVYMSVNKEAPRIQTYIAVKVGGKNDPAETTGLAHYFEHLMFKGTQQFGTSDYAAEKPMLDEIENLFEVYRKTADEAERAAIYRRIDSISYEASKIAIPNEYDKLMSAIGANGTNAFTSQDMTVYVEDIPSNQIDNWAKIQADRFKNPVIRGFHTELETIYEEKNMSLTQDSRKVWEAMDAALFPNHPYGTQTVLGTQEHLKNPSITNVRNYHKTYYVPNNMAVCVSGDFERNGGHDRKVLRRHAAQPEPARTAVRARKADHDSRGEGGLRTRSGQRHAGLASAGRERQIDRHQRHRGFDPLQRTSRTDRPRPEPAAEGALGLRLCLDAARLQFVPRGRTPQDGTVARRSPRPASGGGGKTAGGGLR